jgi:hypothetical protein
MRFKTISGKKDQGALVWRYRDPNNYYIVRANALEDSVVFHKAQDDKWVHLKTKGVAVMYQAASSKLGLRTKPETTPPMTLSSSS